jgi:probable HAF family extracellular repeat protein
MRSAVGLVVSISVLVGSPAVLGAAEARFTGLGFLPDVFALCDLFPEGCISRANAVSLDGSVVVGLSTGANGFEAFQWSREGGIVGLGDLPGGNFSSQAFGVSADGSVIVGSSSSELGASRGEAFRWTQDAGMAALGDLEGGEFVSIAYGVSADGSVVVGRATGSSLAPQAFRWTEEEGMVGLGYLPPSFPPESSEAYGVSADGSIIVGTSLNENDTFEAFRWTESEGIVGIAEPGTGVFPEAANAASADGSTIVGQTFFRGQAFRWTQETGATGLGDLPGGVVMGEALAVSGDGSIVVGSSHAQKGSIITDFAFIWDEPNGIRDLADVLEKEFGVDLAGWRLTAATGISVDGRTIVGYGENPRGSTEAWVADLPPTTIQVEIDIKPGSEQNIIQPGSHGVVQVAILGSEDLDVEDVSPTTIVFGRGQASTVKPRILRDVNRDGLTDLVSRYRVHETGILPGDTEACATGETLDGVPFIGCDSVLAAP